MRWIEYRRDRIDDLWLDRADIARRMEQPHVKRLAESFDATGGEPGNAPWVTDDGTLVAGRDRIAAAMLRGAEEITVRVGEFTPYELRRATLIEQLRRPANQDALVAELVALKEQEFREVETTHDPGTPGHPACPPSRELPNNMFTNSPGRPTTPRGAARAAVAVDTGKTVDAVRAAERRAQEKAAPSATPPLAAPPIRDFGLGLDPALAEAVQRQQDAVDEASAALTAAVANLTKADQRILDLYGEDDIKKPDRLVAEAYRLRDQVRKLGSDVRARRPFALCPFCKGRPIPGVKVCPTCRGRQWVTEAEMANTPPELLREGAAAMMSDGRGGFVGVHRASPGPSEGSAGPNGAVAGSTPARATKRIKVVDDAGQAVAPADDGEDIPF